MSDISDARAKLESVGLPGEPPDSAPEATSLDQAVLDEFERRSQADTDAAPESSGVPDGGPEGAPDTPPDGGTDTPAPDDASGEPGDEEEPPPAGSGASTDGSTEGSAPPAPAFSLGDRNFTTDEIQQAVAVRDWALSLNEQQQAQIDALFSGQYQLVPIGQQPPVVPGGTGAPSPDGVPANLPGGVPAEEWEELPESFRNQFLEMQQRVSALSEGDMEARRTQVVASLTSGTQTFMERHGLSEADVAPVQTKLAQLGVMPGYVQAANGDYSRAMDMALEAVYWSDENFRAAEIERQAAAQIEASKERAKADAKRQSKAGALSGTSGSVPRERSGPLTPADRKAAMVREIAEAQGRGTPSN
jgi:hypothetical protein